MPSWTNGNAIAFFSLWGSVSAIQQRNGAERTAVSLDNDGKRG